jgi:hypothetical protein
MEDENKKGMNLSQLSGTFLLGAIGMLALTIYLIRRLDRE